MWPNCKIEEIGIREGEKLHEVMVTVEDAPMTYEYDKYYIIYPQMVFNDRLKVQPKGKKVPEGFVYSSGTNQEWLTVDQIRQRLKQDVRLEYYWNYRNVRIWDISIFKR